MSLSPVPTHALQLRSLVSDAGAVELSLEEVEVPTPRDGQVLIRVEATPINPSDLGLLLAGADMTQATSGGTPERPVVTAALSPGAQRAARARVGQSLPVGNEGAGTVVAAGASDAAQALVGRVVAVAGGAMYSQYRCVDAAACLPLPEGAQARDGAASFVNPMTVLAMVETMRGEGHRALVHTAAASNLGQMLNRVCIEDGIPLVNIVRSDAQAALLRDQGATYVCDSTSQAFMDELTAALAETGATIAFDAVGGGSLASRILACMEAAASAGKEFSRYGSDVHKQVYIYGGLDRRPTELTRSFGMAWGVGGWLLTPFLMKAGSEKVAEMRGRVGAELTTTFASSYTDEVSLAGALQLDAIAVYGLQATGKKYLINPNA
ncbi:zinc-binding dehydrogenase [Acidiferrimicrobium sp. IK]|uniref:zinc-binding dehydrogenase n=1 Tax=Acidiferrimicrobium sp. IK TaxID=2871700 RepID=UPI0021CB2369|nr:zinc-binding dehydrogenase [Acidiferrimicrobium sp. IK]MCU4182808.1 zinc-binding dehydrogenase [Acidiferrimicrobium sp. IK]